MGRPKKTKEETLEVPSVWEEPQFDRLALLALLKAKMPACFDREPQGMNSGVERLADEIINLLK